MSKIMVSFIICCNLAGFYVYANPFMNEPSAKLELIENFYILETALQNQKTLEEHLQRYSIDAQELQTGDTALHYLSDKIAHIHQTIVSSSLYSVQETLLSLQNINPYLNRQYEQKRELVEYVIVQGASPYIKNKKGDKVIDSRGFGLYVNSILETHSPDTNKIIYKVYLAGHEVFLPFYEKVSNFLQAQVLLFNKYHLRDSEYHIQGLFPPDESKISSYSEYFTVGTEIYKRNRELMNSSHAIIANMTRHDGSSMDVGTAYEIGEMVRAKKTVVGYYDEKIYHLQYEDSVATQKNYSSPEDLVYEHKSFSFRYLEIPDNLMVLIATLSSNEEIQVPSSSWEALFVLKTKLDSRAKQ